MDILNITFETLASCLNPTEKVFVVFFLLLLFSNQPSWIQAMSIHQPSVGCSCDVSSAFKGSAVVSEQASVWPTLWSTGFALWSTPQSSVLKAFGIFRVRYTY